MDPNAALAELRTIFREIDQATTAVHASTLASRAQDIFEGLDTWLSRGGFLPNDWSKTR